MARQLWLLRHAEAEPHGAREDSQRRLTARGEQQARTAGAALARAGVSFDAILFSPKVRARETAELASEQLDADQRARMSEHPPLAGGFDAAQALEALAAAGGEDGGADGGEDARVLLVGHEPDLSRVAGDLTGGRIDLKKGGLAVVRLEGGAPRLNGVVGELAVLLRPRELALLADASLRLGVPVGRE